MTEGAAWGVFLDRDGVLNDVVVDATSGLPESPYRASDVRLLDGAAEAVRMLTGAGAAIGVVSNHASIHVVRPASLNEP